METKTVLDFEKKMDLPPIELEDFKTLCASLFQKRKEKDEIELLLTAKNTELENLKTQILGYFESYNMDSFKIPGLGVVGSQTKFQVNLPRDPGAKDTFMKYMRDNHPDLLTVNHATLNSFFNAQVEAGITEIPGIEEPKARKIITMRMK